MHQQPFVLPTSTETNGPCAILTKVFTFEAAHCLQHHAGKCARLHGHTYQLEVSIRGAIRHQPGHSTDGMVWDFGDLKALCQQTVLDRLSDALLAALPPNSAYTTGGLDHNVLNDIMPMRPTAENLVHWLWDALVEAGLPDACLSRLRLWETPTSCVEITHAERPEPTNEEDV
jgi:6-pyruvoyltetrahydropterin/6-carboxytetrahydropterin synthase